jgi:hypothetical protein
MLWHDDTPRYAVQVDETRNEELADQQFPAASSCGALQARFLTTEAGKTSVRSARPAFFPPRYYGTTVGIPGEVQTGCINAGDRIVSATIYSLDGSFQSVSLTPVLSAIADAAFSGNKTIERPKTLHLKHLGVTIPAPDGVWTTQENVNGSGLHDMLVRVLGDRELTLMPFVLPNPGSCATLTFASNPQAGVVRGAPYVGSSEWTTAFEWRPA